MPDPEPNSIWSGAITVGMISIPVRLHQATQDKSVNFHLLHEPDHGRIKLKPFCATEDREVIPAELVRAFEVGEDQFVTITDKDLDQLPLLSQHTIELVSFVHAAEIDPIFFETSYLVEPEIVGVKAYVLLLKVLERKAMIGIAKIAIGNEERMCALRPRGQTFVLHTLHRADEIREPAFHLPTVLVGDPEITIGSSLVDLLEEPFDPSAYPDGYREALLELIESKIQGEDMVVPAKAPSTTATDLRTVLQESVEAIRQSRHGSTRRPLGRTRPVRRVGGAPAEP